MPLFAKKPASNQTAYDFSFEKISGGQLPLADFKGKTLLIVNTASECGFTKQYKDLQQLYDEFKNRGLVVIGVPANNFGGQEPGSNSEIANFCETRFAVSFPMAAKVDVVGKNAHPFYKWAGSVLGFGTKPKWNFHKYLVNKNGELIDYFNSTTSPLSDRVKQAIESGLS